MLDSFHQERKLVGLTSNNENCSIHESSTETKYAYDALHRTTAIAYPSGSYATSTLEKHFEYDSATLTYNGQSVAMQNAKGRLARAYTGPLSAKSSDLLYSYDEVGRIAEVYQSTTNSGGYYKISGTYWANGVLNTQSQIKRASSVAGSEITIAGLPAITYGLDGAGRVNQVNAATWQNPVTATTYAPAGTITKPSGFLTGVTYGSLDSDTFTPDEKTGRLKKYEFAVNGQTVKGELTWNANGSLASLAITDPYNAPNSQTCAYTHDDLSRIQAVDCGTKWYQSFSFDPFGNVKKTTRTGSDGQAFMPNYSATTNRVTDFPQDAYDANGNLKQDGMFDFAWDAEGKMRSVTSGTTVTATYDAFGRMVEQGRGTSYTQIVYGLGSEKLALLNGATLAKAFVALPGGGTAVYTSSGLSHYRHSDWLGTSRFVSTPNQTRYYSGAYAPYGESYAEADTTERSFTGQNEDTFAGLYDFLFRQYNPVHGRWISPDPAGMAAVDIFNPQSWNRYAYVLNDAMRFIDPLGLECFGIVGWNRNTGYIWGPVPCDAYKGPEPTVAGGDGGGNYGASPWARSEHGFIPQPRQSARQDDCNVGKGGLGQGCYDAGVSGGRGKPWLPQNINRGQRPPTTTPPPQSVQPRFPTAQPPGGGPEVPINRIPNNPSLSWKIRFIMAKLLEGIGGGSGATVVIYVDVRQFDCSNGYRSGACAPFVPGGAY